MVREKRGIGEENKKNTKEKDCSSGERKGGGRKVLVRMV